MSITTVYDVLANHQRIENWTFRDVLSELQLWAERFDFEFKLEIPHIAIAVDHLSSRTLGRFRDGHNGFGLWGEIVIAEWHVAEHRSASDWWRVLGTLLHEQLHAWQQEHGKPGRGNYHNKQFQDKAAGFGLLVSQEGYTEYEPDSLFFDCLARFDVRVPDLPTPEPHKRAGKSKLSLWQCTCPVNVRIGRSDFRARCLDCGHIFQRVEN